MFVRLFAAAALTSAAASAGAFVVQVDPAGQDGQAHGRVCRTGPQPAPAPSAVVVRHDDGREERVRLHGAALRGQGLGCASFSAPARPGERPDARLD